MFPTFLPIPPAKPHTRYSILFIVNTATCSSALVVHKITRSVPASPVSRPTPSSFKSLPISLHLQTLSVSCGGDIFPLFQTQQALETDRASRAGNNECSRASPEPSPRPLPNDTLGNNKKYLPFLYASALFDNQRPRDTAPTVSPHDLPLTRDTIFLSPCNSFISSLDTTNPLLLSTASPLPFKPHRQFRGPCETPFFQTRPIVWVDGWAVDRSTEPTPIFSTQRIIFRATNHPPFPPPLRSAPLPRLQAHFRRSQTPRRSVTRPHRRLGLALPASLGHRPDRFPEPYP